MELLCNSVDVLGWYTSNSALFFKTKLLNDEVFEFNSAKIWDVSSEVNDFTISLPSFVNCIATGSSSFKRSGSIGFLAKLWIDLCALSAFVPKESKSLTFDVSNLKDPGISLSPNVSNILSYLLFLIKVEYLNSAGKKNLMILPSFTLGEIVFFETSST